MTKNNFKHSIYILFFTFSGLAFGQSLQELQKLKAEYEKFKENQNQTIIPGANLDQMDPSISSPRTATITPLNNQFTLVDTADNFLSHFGYDFFVRRDTISFWENLPIPSGYLLGPGDEVIISIWGETEFQLDYVISRDGTIYDEKVGRLNLTGKTLDEANDYLKLQFGRVYSTLKGRTPTTFIDISIGTLRLINVNIVGEVAYPGVYPVHPFSNIITALIQAGGVDTTGSLRKIKLKRAKENDIYFDLYDYLLKGNIPNDIQLRDQDIIVVPTRKSTITIDSSVVRPGIYESIVGESVKELIDYAGGLKPSASPVITLKRIQPIKKDPTSEPNIENYYINYQNSDLTRIENGDSLIVRNMFYSSKQVEIIGQVKRPGIYPFYKGMTLKNLIKLGGGFGDTTFVKSIYMKSAEIVRRDPNSPYEQVININLEKFIVGNDDLELQNLDRFVVHANRNFFEKKNVQILGEVNIPGSYPLIREKETLRSLIDRAGGMTKKALKDGVSIYRDKKYVEKGLSKDPTSQTYQPFMQANPNIIPNTPLELDDGEIEEKWIRVAWENENVRLMPGDSVIIREETGTINISGEVYNPGLIEYQKGKSLREYINLAGGVTLSGDKNDVIVIYANGVVIPKKFMRSPKVLDGSTIIVNQKELKEPFDITGFASSLLSIISTTVTILVLSKQLESG